MTTSTIATQLEPSPALPITPSWAIPSGQGTVTLWGTVLQVVLFWCTKCVLRKEGGPWGDRGQHDSCSSPMQTSFQQPGDRGQALCQLAPPLRHRSKKHCTPFFTFLFFFFFPLWFDLGFPVFWNLFRNKKQISTDMTMSAWLQSQFWNFSAVPV